jgi:hypothetical protein
MGGVMPNISLTDFVDIVSASGTSKATKVRQAKNRDDYNPAFDFYKKLRETIINVHKEGATKKALDTCLENLTDSKKKAAYPKLVEGYKKWWGRKKLLWFDISNQLFIGDGIDVRVNPELGLQVNGTPHLIKLYFKKDEIKKNRIDIITHLMDAVLSEKCPPNTVMAVLDIRRGKLFKPTVPIDGLSAMLNAELAYINSLWNDI